jgi:DNA modification methylase
VRLLLQADARALPIASGAVSCVVTSPPYWGLRDYGTAQWIGGDPSCGHVERQARGDAGRLSTDRRRGVNPAPVDTPMQYRDGCHDCGAVRVDAQLGLEPTPDAYVANLVRVFREVRRVLRPDGTVWLNLGDSYAGGGVAGSAAAFNGKQGTNRGSLAMIGRPLAHGVKPKDLCGIPWRVAFALQADGWYLRADIIWAKPNPMPESVTDRPTKAHEYVFLLTQSERYFYDADAIADRAVTAGRVGGFTGCQAIGANVKPSGNQIPERGAAYVRLETRNCRSVWSIGTMPYAGAHFATMPEALAERCILAGSPLGGLVLDPFCGSGTTIAVAERLGRHGVGVDLTYHGLAKERTAQRGLPLGTVGTEREYGVANGGESRRSVTNGSTAERTAEPAVQGRFH